MSVPVRDFLKARRDRALGTILGYAEQNIWGKLEPADRSQMRSVVIDALNSYHDSVLDLVKSDDASNRNDEVIALLERLYGQVSGDA